MWGKKLLSQSPKCFSIDFENSFIELFVWNCECNRVYSWELITTPFMCHSSHFYLMFAVRQKYDKALKWIALNVTIHRLYIMLLWWYTNNVVVLSVFHESFSLSILVFLLFLKQFDLFWQGENINNPCINS